MVDAFLALLVVANVLPILPIALRFAGEYEPERRRPLLLGALVIGNTVALLLAIGGEVLLRVTGIVVADVRIAGGLILLVFAIFDLLFSREQRKEALVDAVESPLGPAVVPLAMPLLVGPATLATVIVVAQHHGRLEATLAVAGNAAINAVLLVFGERIHRALGPGFARAMGKVMGVVLAALAVAMIRGGVTEAIQVARGT